MAIQVSFILRGVMALYGVFWLLLLEVKAQSGSNVLSWVAEVAFNIEHLVVRYLTFC